MDRVTLTADRAPAPGRPRNCYPIRQRLGPPLSGYAAAVRPIPALPPPGRVLRTWSPEATSVARDACFSPDGKLIATAGPAVHLLDCGSGAVVRTLRNSRYPTWAVAFTPDGRHLASGGDDPQTLSLWEVLSGEQVSTSTLLGADSLRDLAFSRDGSRVVSAQVLFDRPLHLRDLFRPAAYRDFAEKVSNAQRALEVDWGDAPALRCLGESVIIRSTTASNTETTAPAVRRDSRSLRLPVTRGPHLPLAASPPRPPPERARPPPLASAPPPSA